MDIKAEVTKLVAKFTGDPELLNKFKSDPIGTVKSLVGENFSADDIKNIAGQIKEALPAGKAGVRPPRKGPGLCG